MLSAREIFEPEVDAIVAIIGEGMRWWPRMWERLFAEHAPRATRRPSTGRAQERAYRQQLHVIVWLLESGDADEASRVALEGPWTCGGG